MILSNEDAKLFYNLWFPLLDYVNEEYRIEPDLGKITGTSSVDPQAVVSIADFLWNRPQLIEEYLTAYALPEEHHDIVSSWKRRIRGTFILERNLKKGSMFISEEDNTVYRVLGIYSSWEEMFGGCPLPVIMKATLIPFKNVIISDGLVFPYRVMFGSGMRADFKECYMEAKRKGQIHSSL